MTTPIASSHVPKPGHLNDLSDGCCVPECDLDPDPDAPFPICRRHMGQVLRYFDGHAARLMRGERR